MSFVLIEIALTSRKYLEIKSFIVISSLFFAMNVIDIDINFWEIKFMNFFDVSVNMSNKEYNVFVISETVIWQFFLHCYSKILQLSWIHLASLLSKALSHRNRVNANNIFVFMKHRILTFFCPLSKNFWISIATWKFSKYFNNCAQNLKHMRILYSVKLSFCRRIAFIINLW